MRGRFIALEGIEGCGKSTQSELLIGRLRDARVEVVATREPGATQRGRAIRDLLLDPTGGPLSARAEALLYAADRAIHVAEVIEPALDAGRWVVSDRFSDSYRAYQGFGRGLDLDEVDRLSTWASSGLEPDLVILLDLEVGEGATRLKGERDRIELEDADFHARVRAGFLALAQASSDRFRVLDASGDIESVAAAIWSDVTGLLEV